MTYKSESETLELGTKTEFGDRNANENWEEVLTYINTEIEDERVSHERTPVFPLTSFISSRLHNYLGKGSETLDSHKIDSAIKSDFCDRRMPSIFL